ncbi:MAG: AAA family ATPase [Tyzzerella sp.]|nr:AAA family ATPase [Tyzzerella sp.]
MNIIIIAGMPASGKSTVAAQISNAFGYPILEKDAIKEELFDTIGFTNYAEKRRHDVAATAVLLRCTDALLQGGSSFICVNNFRPEVQSQLQEILDRNKCHCVTVFFGGDADEFYKRYVERDQKHLRHLGHVLQDHYPPRAGDSLDYTMTRQEFAEKFEQLGMADFKISGPRIEVDATYPERIDVDKLIADIRRALGKE